uniref:Negative elongation factor complex member B n=1 Tax=Canis lupus familiaris TaxID=9615 RepID=A0A8C0S728_CANLF
MISFEIHKGGLARGQHPLRGSPIPRCSAAPCYAPSEEPYLEGKLTGRASRGAGGATGGSGGGALVHSPLSGTSAPRRRFRGTGRSADGLRQTEVGGCGAGGAAPRAGPGRAGGCRGAGLGWPPRPERADSWGVCGGRGGTGGARRGWGAEPGGGRGLGHVRGAAGPGRGQRRGPEGDADQLHRAAQGHRAVPGGAPSLLLPAGGAGGSAPCGRILTESQPGLPATSSPPPLRLLVGRGCSCGACGRPPQQRPPPDPPAPTASAPPPPQLSLPPPRPPPIPPGCPPTPQAIPQPPRPVGTSPDPPSPASRPPGCAPDPHPGRLPHSPSPVPAHKGPLSPQTENGVLLPSLQSALPFLDLHGTPRLEFHQSVFDELRDKLLERVSAIASEGKAEERYKKLEDLLEKSFSLVKMPSLQPVVMCVMKHLPKVPEKKLKLVMADKELYRACAVEVKRQIWQDNQALFGDEVSPLLKQYILEKESALFSTELSVLHNFFSPSPKARRQGEVVQKLTQMVGKNVKLYDMVLQFLRTLFLRTRNVHYCTLRAELLMSLHELDVGDICSVDPCHKFTWCLDACIRERFVDSKRARELQGFLDGVKKGQEQVLGDLSMILCDPFAINTLSLSTVRHLQELVGQETLPRDSPDLLLLLRLLALGQGAWDMIDSQVFKEPKMEVELITRFLPMLMSFVVDDHTFNVDQKLPAEEKAPVTYPNTLPESFTKFLQEQRMACEVGLYYVLHITKQRNKNALLRLLPGLVETFGDLAFGDIFLHLLMGNLALLADEFALEDFCRSLFDGFLLTASPRKENVQRHVLRLLIHLHHRVAPSKLEALRKALEPTGQSGEAVKELYSQLGEKLEQLEHRKPSPAQAAETPALELPLPTVSTPAGL